MIEVQRLRTGGRKPVSAEHLLRKAILICQASALSNTLTDSEMMSAIMHVYCTLSAKTEMSGFSDGGKAAKDTEA